MPEQLLVSRVAPRAGTAHVPGIGVVVDVLVTLVVVKVEVPVTVVDVPVTLVSVVVTLVLVAVDVAVVVVLTHVGPEPTKPSSTELHV